MVDAEHVADAVVSHGLGQGHDPLLDGVAVPGLQYPLVESAAEYELVVRPAREFDKVAARRDFQRVDRVESDLDDHRDGFGQAATRVKDHLQTV